MGDEQKRLEEGTLKDRGIARNLSSDDLESNANNRRMLIGLRLPHRPKRPKKNRKKGKSEDKVALVNPSVAQSPTETVQNLLTEVDDDKHQPHTIFSQLDLYSVVGADRQWREYARWVKYEEDVEEGGERWSKPHVASLSLHSLFELRSTILNGALLLDLDAFTIGQVVDLIMDQLINNKMLEEDLKDEIRNVFTSHHTFAHQSRRRRSLMPGSDSKKGFGRVSSTSALLKSNKSFPNMDHLAVNGELPESASSVKLNVDFMRKIPDDAQVCNVMVGELSSLKYQVSAFVRLSEARILGELTEVPLPTRFLFFLLGPAGSEAKCIEIGRSLSTVMVDEIYREVAYKARNRQEVLTGLDEFLDQVTVLPPGEWDPKIRIEPPDKVPSQEARKTQKAPMAAGPHTSAVQEVVHESHCDPTLVRTGKLFGGLVADIKRKIPHYASDFKDALHIQCIASTIFLFLATLTPNVTFGGLLGQATDQYMGTMECILAAAVTGILFALFSGQPLNILGSTGPMLVLEMILYNFCHDAGWDYMPLRCWIGLWTAFFLLLVVAFDLSALVRYITRFTEESFACLIALIFIYEAFKKQFHIVDEYGINPNPDIPISRVCDCFPPGYKPPVVTEFMNDTNVTTTAAMTTGMVVKIGAGVTETMYDTVMSVTNSTTPNVTQAPINWTSLYEEMCDKLKGVKIGDRCDNHITSYSSLPVMFMYMLYHFFSMKELAPIGVTETMYDTVMNVTNGTTPNVTQAPINWTSLSEEMCDKLKGVKIGDGCDNHIYPDVFFLSMLLFFFTFGIAWFLKEFKTSGYFPSFVRQLLSDFAVLLSIVIMVGIDMAIGINTPKLEVPTEFTPSKPGRKWFISPYSDKNPVWTMFAAAIPAILALVLIFMDQQITAVIVNRKENKLVKGSGYHLDMLVVAVCIVICSLFGLPWYVAATVSAIAHIMSLKKESECAAPGEKPIFLGCREQRVTALLVGILSGLAVLLTGVLRVIPMPVLYGVFLYMGAAALRGMQFVDRLCLLFMPAKYQPDHSYLRHVRINRVHMFTFLQIICLAVLWVIKMVKAVSIIFPIMVVGTCFVRKGMDWLFTQYELQYLDDIMPGEDKNAKEDELKKHDGHEEDDDMAKDEREIMMDLKMQHAQGEKYGYFPVPSSDRVNISEEVNRTGIWLQVRRDSVPAFDTNGTPSPQNSPHIHRHHHHHHHHGGPKKRLTADKRNGSVEGKSADFFIPEENENE